MSSTTSADTYNSEQITADILKTIEREREREIIARRFGLFDRKETLEQIGELLGITRERVRQLEKAVVARLKAKAEQNLPHIETVEALLINRLDNIGKASRISELAQKLNSTATKLDVARLSFLAELCPKLTVIEENDHFYHGVVIASAYTDKSVKETIAKIIESIKSTGEPTAIEDVTATIKHNSPMEVRALASLSKDLATLHNRWGLVKWPMVNPKNIRDKIYVILREHGKQMHFNEIAEAIKDSAFKRKDVTVQAIHNELIKDKRFVLIGRGIYALKEWGYEKGTVADVISKILIEAGEPLHRDEIVKRVLKERFVKETTILLNLQGKPQFKRVAKATYALSE